MTCIVAMVDPDGGGHIACDSLGSNGFTGSEYLNQKIFRKGEMLIGYTGSYRTGQLLEHQLVLPPRKVGQTTDNYIYVDFVNAVRQLLKDSGRIEIDRNVEESPGTFLAVYDGRIFKVQCDLAVLESSDPFDACGSGGYHAKGALYVMNKVGGFTPKQMVTGAVEAAARFVVSVGGDIRYLNQKGKTA